MIERLMLNINMEYYNNKVNANGHSIKALLYNVAERRCLIGAALHLQQTNKKGCSSVLKMLVKSVESLMVQLDRTNSSCQKAPLVTTQDLRMLRNANKEQK